MPWWPFALFVVVDVDHKTIDDILGAHIGGYAPSLWLASNNYDDAPRKPPPESRHVSEGTRPPILRDFRSPWIGCKLDELVQWLKSKPGDCDLNDRHFAVLDKGARDDPPTVVVCRTGDFMANGDKLFVLRFDKIGAVEHLAGAPSETWDESTKQGERNADIDYGDSDYGDSDYSDS